MSLPRSAYSKLRRDPLGYFARLKAEQGDVVSVRLGRNRLFLISHPSDVHRVLVANERNYMTAKVAFRRWSSPQAAAGRNGLLLSTDPHVHLHARRRIQRAFRQARIDAQGAVIDETAMRAVGRWSPERPFAPLPALQQVTTEIFAEVAFGNGALATEDLVADVRACLATADAFSSTPRELALRLHLARIIRLSRSYERILSRLEELFERRAAGEEDAISLLLQENDVLRPLDRRGLAIEAFGLLTAAAETTATNLAWALQLLVTHPQVAARVRVEIESGGAPATDLPYLRAVFLESLRLYPPAWRIPLQAREADSLGGRTIPAGSLVWISPYLVHRDERWYEDANEFRPDRWLENSIDRPRSAFLAFGAGPHQCIGEMLVWREFAAIVPAVLRWWSVFLEQPGRPHAATTLRPRGLVVSVLSRQDS